MKVGIILIATLIISCSVVAQVAFPGGIKKRNPKEPEVVNKAPNISNKEGTKVYVTGSSAGDSKLKEYKKKMDALKLNMEEFEKILNSNEIVYDVKIRVGTNGLEGSELQLVHKDIENNIDGPEKELKSGKKYAPEYGFIQEEKEYTDFKEKYKNLKANSNAQALKWKKSMNSVNYKNSPDYHANEYVKQKMFEDKPEDPIYSDFHLANKGNIVFAAEKISKENPKAAKLDNNFNAVDRIYGRVFMDKSFINQTLLSSNGDSMRCDGYAAFPYYLIYIDNVKQDFRYDTKALNASDVKASTRQIWLYPKVTDGLTEIEWIKAVHKMTPGIHKVKIEYYMEEKGDARFEGNQQVYTNYKKQLASGEFSIKKNTGDVLKVGKKWSEFDSPMNGNSALFKSITNLVMNDKIGLEGGDEKKEIKIVSKDWKIVTEKITGVPIYRWITVQIKIIEADGFCKTKAVGIRQDYLSKGNYDSKVLFVNFLNVSGFNGYLDNE